MDNTFTAVFEKLDDWYIGYIEELPGANVQEKTLQEARESLREAIELILFANDNNNSNSNSIIKNGKD